MDQDIQFGEHIIIEPVVPLTEERKVKRHLDLSIQLKNIPKALNVKKKIVLLKGAN